MIKYVFLIICLLFASPVAFADDSVVAIVNNEIITRKDLDDFISFMRVQLSSQYSQQEIEQRISQMLPDLINRLIEDSLILQAAYKEEIIIEQSRIDARIEQLKQKYPSETEFKESLAAQGLSVTNIRLKIKEQFLMFEIIERQVRSKIVVQPQEVTAYYDAHAQDLIVPEQRHVRFLAIDDTSIIPELEKSLAEYKDLETLSWAYSLEITDLGWVNSKQLRPEISDLVFGLGAGKLSSILYADDGIYIFEVKAVKPAEKRSLQDVQEEINRLLFEGKMQERLVQWLDELRSGAYIHINQ